MACAMITIDTTDFHNHEGYLVHAASGSMTKIRVRLFTFGDCRGHCERRRVGFYHHYHIFES